MQAAELWIHWEDYCAVHSPDSLVAALTNNPICFDLNSSLALSTSAQIETQCKKTLKGTARKTTLGEIDGTVELILDRNGEEVKEGSRSCGVAGYLLFMAT